MISKKNFSKLSFFILLLSAFEGAYAQDIGATSTLINDNKQEWFNNLSSNIINSAPEEGSKIAEWDRVVSNEMQKTTGSRLELANADKSQDANYLYNSFMDKIFGEEIARSLGNLSRDDWYFYYMEDIYKKATYAWDDQANRNRSIDFILNPELGSWL